MGYGCTWDTDAHGTPPILDWILSCAGIYSYILYIHMYSVFTINVPLAVRFAMVTISVRKADSSEYGRLGRDFY